ncbi:hypothetical protein [Bordetella bronchiseptica]|uniref:hypothetical protein n=1 Tax=Bordetella bronchiseptica TaxID=518 RepID=UPI000460DA56|nr:hypothetical protein [Bordetella bronchiseptica]KDD18723.1 hypothetical protein L522_4179 [Bordetella bronchiseptica MBORD707]
MAFDIKKAVAKAAKITDMNQAQKGGGAYTPPAEGKPGVRFIAYVELGPQKETFKGVERVREMVKLVFELHGKKWPKDQSGQPPRMTITIAKSLNEKAAFYKLFKQMNYSGKYTHMAEMLGQDFSGQVFHRKVGEGADQKVYAGFKDPASGMIAITPPFVADEDGEDKRRNIPPAVADLRLFLWDCPDKDQWASIYIEGAYDDGKSKNVFQDAIKASPGFEGSPVEALLMGDPDTGDGDDVEAAKAEAKKAAKSPKKSKAAPAPVPEDDDDEDGTNSAATSDDNPLADLEDDE